jgi:hypothetical protein|tara:strand:+ start:2006 stop:2287 length:282 start_codon:yes stop_codon:yes gene_type:complete
MGYTTIKVHAEQLAALLSRRKVEKKYEDLGWSAYEETYEEYIGAKFTEDAQKDYDRHYQYFLELILSKETATEKRKLEVIDELQKEMKDGYTE